MGFWQALGKIVQGKPVFENPEHIGTDRADVESADVVVPVRPGFDEKGKKIIPIVQITSCRTDSSGDRMKVWAYIKNTSAVPVRLEKMTLAGQSRHLGNFLTAGEQEQVMIYDGPRPRIDSYSKAELYYMQMNTNDYFNAEFMVEYEFESDGTYTVSELQAYDYVRDI